MIDTYKKERALKVLYALVLANRWMGTQVATSRGLTVRLHCSKKQNGKSNFY